jgi:hypothetical protein
MTLEFRHSPFISFSTGNHKHPSIGDVLRVEPSLDLLVQSPLGKLYWNKGVSSVGLVCGTAVSLYSRSSAKITHVLYQGAWHGNGRGLSHILSPRLTHLKTNETNVIARRLMASHLSDPMAQVLVYVRKSGIV